MVAETSEVSAEREILLTRRFAAPRSMVWAAWIDPWQVAQWWGPKGFTSTITEMDVRVGGKWTLTMHGPDGTNFPSNMEFTEVVPMERVAYKLMGCREGEPVMMTLHTTITFADEGDDTRLTFHTVFASVEAYETAVQKFGAIEGGEQMFDRLTEILAANPAPVGEATHALSITREFNAPRELVWQAWTDPAMAQQWSGPKQFPAKHIELGQKPGDRWRICLHGVPPGSDTPVELWQGGVLREIKPPEKLVYTFAWERRSAVGLPEDGDPRETVITVRLDENGGKTTMHFHQAFFATASERDGHNGGWSSSFERLQDVVEGKKEKAMLPLEMSLKRVFRAPRAIAYDAWTKPEQIAQWWGPKGFTNPRCEVDVTPGGELRIDMRGPDGTVYPMTGEFVEVMPPERLVFLASALDGDGKPMFVNRNIVTFTEVPGGTEIALDVRVVSMTAEAMKYLPGLTMGWSMSFDKLEEYLG